MQYGWFGVVVDIRVEDCVVDVVGVEVEVGFEDGGVSLSFVELPPLLFW